MHGRGRAIAIAGTVSALAALAWLVGAYDTGGQAVASPGGSPAPVAYVVPVIVLLSALGAAWYFLTRVARESSFDDAPRVDCDSCGRTILREWRLCPYCGARVAPPVHEQPDCTEPDPT
jgi:hypothetical protein